MWLVTGTYRKDATNLGHHREDKLISFRPVTTRIASRVMRRSFVQLARRTVEVAPGTKWEVAPPIMLPDEPTRIVGHSPDSTPATNLARLTQKIIEQGPTRIHLLEDVILAHGTILARTAYDRLGKGSRSPLLLGAAEQIPEAALCTTQMTEKYFGHWLKDGVAHELLASDLGQLALVLDPTDYSHRAAYRSLLGLAPHRSKFVHCERLWLLEDHETNSHFISRYERLRQRMRPGMPSSNVFLSRGDSVGRKLLNEDEIRAALPGFIFIHPDRMTAAELRHILSTASLVISPEGSAISHATITMPRGSTLLTIIGAQHFNMPYKVLCDGLGIKFALTIADAVGNDFIQPVDRLLKTIEACQL